MSAKTVFTRAERAELDRLIAGMNTLVVNQQDELRGPMAVIAFLDRYTEAAIPEHILACARHYLSSEGDEMDKDLLSAKYADIFSGQLWARAIDEVLDEKP